MPMMMKTCPKCGWKNPEEQGNCLYCTRSLNDVAPEEEAPPKKPGLFDFESVPQTTVCQKREGVFKWRVAFFVCLISIIILIDIAISSEGFKAGMIGGVIAALICIGIPLTAIKGGMTAIIRFGPPTPEELTKGLTVKKSKRFIVENRVLNTLLAIAAIAVIMVAIHNTLLVPKFTIRVTGTEGLEFRGRYGQSIISHGSYDEVSGIVPTEYTTIRAYKWVDVEGSFCKLSEAGTLKVEILIGDELIREAQVEEPYRCLELWTYRSR
jgi:hypothetical protein